MLLQKLPHRHVPSGKPITEEKKEAEAEAGPANKGHDPSIEIDRLRAINTALVEALTDLLTRAEVLEEYLGTGDKPLFRPGLLANCRDAIALALGVGRLPTTPEEVAAAEADLAANPVELPESLRDPLKLLDDRTGGPPY